MQDILHPEKSTAKKTLEHFLAGVGNGLVFEYLLQSTFDNFYIRTFLIGSITNTAFLETRSSDYWSKSLTGYAGVFAGQLLYNYIKSHPY